MVDEMVQTQHFWQKEEKIITCMLGHVCHKFVLIDQQDFIWDILDRVPNLRSRALIYHDLAQLFLTKDGGSLDQCWEAALKENAVEKMIKIQVIVDRIKAQDDRIDCLDQIFNDLLGKEDFYTAYEVAKMIYTIDSYSTCYLWEYSKKILELGDEIKIKEVARYIKYVAQTDPEILADFDYKEIVQTLLSSLTLYKIPCVTDTDTDTVTEPRSVTSLST